MLTDEQIASTLPSRRAPLPELASATGPEIELMIHYANEVATIDTEPADNQRHQRPYSSSAACAISGRMFA